MKVLEGKKASKQILELLSPGPYRIHSRFKNGINIEICDKLGFIGMGNTNIPPIGVSLKSDGDNDFTDIGIDHLYWNEKLNRFESSEIIIDLSNIDVIDNRLSGNLNMITLNNLEKLVEIVDSDIVTGFGKTIGYLSSIEDDFVKDLCLKFSCLNPIEIENTLKKWIGRGIGLTPSGDDFLQGILYINEMVPILGIEFIEILKNLINIGEYTTDISNNYFQCALCKMYSSTLIYLQDAISIGDSKAIKRFIDELLEFGNTSGSDILAGILTGINYALKYPI